MVAGSVCAVCGWRLRLGDHAMVKLFRKREQSPFEPEASELHEQLREIGYLVYRDVPPFKWLGRKFGMRPKDWIREREERDASNQDTKDEA